MHSSAQTDAPLFTPLQRFWRLIKPDSKEIRDIYAYAVFNGLIALSLPLGIQAIVNLIQGGQVNTSWIVLVVIVVMGVAATGLLQIFQLRITENIQQKIFSRAAFEFAYRIPRIRMEVMYKHYAPELMNRFFDTISVQKGLSKLLIDFSAAILQVFFGLLLLSLYHPFFVLFSLTLVVIIIAIIRFTARKGLETSLLESKYKYQVAHWLEEVARTASTFKLAGRTDLPLERVDKHVGSYLNARESHFKVLIQQYSLMVVFKVLVATGLLAIGGVLVMQQLMNIGQFIAAEIIVLLVMGSVEKLILSFEVIYDVLTSLEKIGQVTDMELENEDGVDLEKDCQAGGLGIAMDNVKFSYPDHGQPILSGMSFRADGGEKIAVLGPNGSGKSTFLQLIAGLYDVDEGQVTYNGMARGNLELCSLREVLGDSLSQEQLFDGTLLENITMGRTRVSLEDAKEAVRAVGLQGYVQSLPKGFNTHLDPQGKKLSRSITQKLLIARSIAARPKLLLLEEALEHIDPMDRREIIDYLTHPDKPWTLIAVTTDPYLVEKCGKILILKEGRVFRQGTFNELKNQIEAEGYVEHITK
ncbi:MAG: ABC transporter ATP-binding protein [Flavobacteriales bacterium]|nr:ABC transporter ATP-binding protein [Flavobacteriales bacterium]